MPIRSVRSAAALAAFAFAVAASGAAFAAKTLVYCSEGSPEGFNPQFFTTGTTADAASVPIYNRLVEFEIGTTNIVPGLAESWSAAPDGLSYTFKLRHGVKFHSNAKFTPTRDFNADDVLFSYNRMADPNHPFAKVTPGQTYAYFDDMGMKDIVERVEKVDPMTVRFVLKKPEAPFMADMAMDFASILSAEYADKMMAAKTPDVIDREPIGTGPFQFVSYQKDAVIRYKAFDQHWGGRPKIDNLVYAITTDASVRYAKLKTGECHAMAFPKPADVALMKNDPNINLVSQQGLNVGYIAFNVEKKPFDSKLVRQALNLAVNKKAILDNVFQGAGQLAKNPIPPTLWSYNDKIAEYPYDPAKAKALLAQAGYPNGVDVELWYLPVTRPYNPDGKRMAELIQADWEKVGVRTKLITYEWGEYRKRSKTGEQHSMMFGWSGDNGDPDNFFVPLLGCAAVKGGGNVSRWCNNDFESLVQKAKLATRQADRAAFYAKAQEIAHDEAPWIPVAHSVRFDPVRKDVVGYKMDATAHHFFNKVDMTGQWNGAVTGVLAFVLKRLALVVPTFLGITLLVFSLIRLIPGDPVEALSGERGMTPERYQRLIHEFGLDRPLPVQYGEYVWRALHGDLGISVVTHEPVFAEFAARFPATVELSLAAMLFALVLGIPAGIVAAVKRNTVWDYSVMGASLTGYSMPIFWWGLLLILTFSVGLGWTPVSGRLAIQYDIAPVTGFMLVDSILSGDKGALRSALSHLILPAIALGTIPLAVIARMTRSSMLEVLREDYVRTARAKGAGRVRVVAVHALRNALIPVVTTIGLQIGTLFAGAILTETIFAWPGVGKWLVEAIHRRDYAAVQGGILCTATIIIGVNLVVDVLYGVINPRIRHS